MSLKSELLSQHPEIFVDQDLLAMGFFPDSEITVLARNAGSLFVWCTDYTQFRSLMPADSEISSGTVSGQELIFQNGRETIVFGSEPQPAAQPSRALIYMSKNKKENIFYIRTACNLLPEGSEVFVIGGNDEGVRGMETILKNTGPSEKYDYGRKCTLFRLLVTEESRNKAGVPTLSPAESPEYYHTTIGNTDLKVAMIPGVFSMDRADAGTLFLLENLGDLNLSRVNSVLDAGTGSGIIAVFLKKLLPHARVTAVDVSAFALEAARKTALLNDAEITVMPSDMLENTARYDLIISNPPFHVGKRQVFGPVLNLIRDCPGHLMPGGTFLMVANAFLPYEDHLSRAFCKSGIKNRNSQYKILYGFTKTLS